MRKIYVPVSVLLVLLITFIAYSVHAKDGSLPNPYVKAYPFKSAVIHYKNTITYGHGTFEGTTVAYIKADKTAMVTKMTVPDVKSGKTQKVESMQIIGPEYIYLINMTSNAGTKLDNSTKFTKAAYEALSASEKKAFHERLAKSRGIVSMDLPPLGLKEKTEEVLGRKCDLYHLNSGFPEGTVDSEYWDEKTCVWGTTGIVLKRIEERHGVLTTQIATKIEEDVSIPDSKFVVPKGTKITYDEATSEYRKNGALAAFNSLKTGEPMTFKFKLKGTKVKAKGKTSKEE